MSLYQKMETKIVKLSASTCNRSWSQDGISRLQLWIRHSPFPNTFSTHKRLFLPHWTLHLISGCNKNYSIKTLNLLPNQNIRQMHTSITMISGLSMQGLFGILWVSSAPVWFPQSVWIGFWNLLPKTGQWYNSTWKFC